MYKILKKEELSDAVVLFEIDAPEIAKKARTGNLIVLKIHK